MVMVVTAATLCMLVVMHMVGAAALSVLVISSSCLGCSEHESAGACSKPIVWFVSALICLVHPQCGLARRIVPTSVTNVVAFITELKKDRMKVAHNPLMHVIMACLLACHAFGSRLLLLLGSKGLGLRQGCRTADVHFPTYCYVRQKRARNMHSLVRAVLLPHPDGWQFSKKHIALECSSQHPGDSLMSTVVGKHGAFPGTTPGLHLRFKLPAPGGYIYATVNHHAAARHILEPDVLDDNLASMDEDETTPALWCLLEKPSDSPAAAASAAAGASSRGFGSVASTSTDSTFTTTQQTSRSFKTAGGGTNKDWQQKAQACAFLGCGVLCGAPLSCTRRCPGTDLHDVGQETGAV
jgi:hypothetical protein